MHTDLNTIMMTITKVIKPDVKLVDEGVQLYIANRMEIPVCNITSSMTELQSLECNDFNHSMHGYWTCFDRNFTLPLTFDEFENEIQNRTFLPSPHREAHAGEGPYYLSEDVYHHQWIWTKQWAQNQSFSSQISHIYKASEIIQCIEKYKYSLLQMDGDSLVRHMFDEIRNVYDYNLKKMKLINSVQHWKIQHRQHKYMTIDNITYHLSSDYNLAQYPNNVTCNQSIPSFINILKDDNDNNHNLQWKDINLIWLYQTGLWDIPYNTSFEDYEIRIDCMVRKFENIIKMFNNGSRIVIALTTNYQSGAPELIMHATTLKHPKSNRKHLIANARISQYNDIILRKAYEIQSKYPQNVYILDLNSISCQRQDGTYEGIHYPGIVTKTFVNEFINLVCDS